MNWGQSHKIARNAVLFPVKKILNSVLLQMWFILFHHSLEGFVFWSLKRFMAVTVAAELHSIFSKPNNCLGHFGNNSYLSSSVKDLFIIEFLLLASPSIVKDEVRAGCPDMQNIRKKECKITRGTCNTAMFCMQYDPHYTYKNLHSISPITHLGQTINCLWFSSEFSKGNCHMYFLYCLFSCCHYKGGNVMKRQKLFLQGLTLLNILKRKTNNGFIIALELFLKEARKVKRKVSKPLWYMVLYLKIQKWLF